MILSDSDLLLRLDGRDPIVRGIRDTIMQVQPASIDLRISDDYVLPSRGMRIKADTYALQPGEFVLASTIEIVHTPLDLVARVDGRSSFGRLGLVVHSTAGFIDPGFIGVVTLELSNVSDRVINLTKGDRVCQVSFAELKTPCARPYGPGRGSSYQGQSKTTLSAFTEEPT